MEYKHLCVSNPSSVISSDTEVDHIGIQEKGTSLYTVCVNIEGSGENTRHGCTKDTEILKQLFPYCEQDVYTKFDKKEQEEFFKTLADKGRYFTHIICFILAHGCYNYFTCYDNSQVHIPTFTEKVVLLPSLQNKFIWLCYGTCRLYEEDGQGSEHKETKHKNTIISYGTSPGMKSIRDKDEGTLYIKLLAKTFSQNRITKEAFDVLTNLVEREAEKHKIEQKPCYEWNILEDLFIEGYNNTAHLDN